MADPYRSSRQPRFIAHRPGPSQPEPAPPIFSILFFFVLIVIVGYGIYFLMTGDVIDRAVQKGETVLESEATNEILERMAETGKKINNIGEASLPQASYAECRDLGNPSLLGTYSFCRSRQGVLVNQSSLLVEWDQFKLCSNLSTVCAQPACAFRDNGISCVDEPCDFIEAYPTHNGCLSCEDPSTFGYIGGDCDSNFISICDKELVRVGATDRGRICMDRCPANYDSFPGRTGTIHCVQHFGEIEIASWPTCTNSNSQCTCMVPMITTDGIELDHSEARCVPYSYYSMAYALQGQPETLPWA